MLNSVRAQGRIALADGISRVLMNRRFVVMGAMNRAPTGLSSPCPYGVREMSGHYAALVPLATLQPSK